MSSTSSNSQRRRGLAATEKADPIGYAVASADWWRARLHGIDTPRKVFPAPTAQALALAAAGAICALAVVGMTVHKLSVARVVRTIEDGSHTRVSRLAAA